MCQDGHSIARQATPGDIHNNWQNNLYKLSDKFGSAKKGRGGGHKLRTLAELSLILAKITTRRCNLQWLAYCK